MRVFVSVISTLRKICGSFTGATGFLIVITVLLAAIFAPWIAGYDPDQLDVLNRFSPPSAAHLLGTDHLGRDLFSRLVHGSTIAMSVALTSIAIALSIGTVMGLFAGYLSSRVESLILILFDVIWSFPSLVLALAIVAVYGPSTRTVIIVVAITLIPHFGRVVRAQVLTLRNAPFLEAERILGASELRIIFHHVLPNIIGPLVVLASMDIPGVITIEAGLSFLGLGVRPPLASWGTLIQDGYQFLSESWLPVLVSSFALAGVTLGFTLFGEAVRDAVDPRIRQENG